MMFPTNTTELDYLALLSENGFLARGDIKAGNVIVFLAEGGDSSFCGSYPTFEMAARSLVTKKFN